MRMPTRTLHGDRAQPPVLQELQQDQELWQHVLLRRG